MSSGLHNEMVALHSLGILLEGSERNSTLVKTGLASAGTTESHLTAASVTHTRQAYQIKDCLYDILEQAHHDSHAAEEQNLTFEDWCSK